MSSQVDICNAAIGHYGGSARVSSIDPPDGSVESDRCAIFYPKARRLFIAATAPKWAQKRATLALLATNPSVAWTYAYDRPADCIKPLRVLAQSTGQSLGSSTLPYTEWSYADPIMAIDAAANDSSTAQFDHEGETIYTHEPEAVLLYLYDRDEPTRLTPEGELAMGYLLASLLAGGAIKGRPGAGVAKTFYDLGMMYARQAAASDGNSAMSQHQVVAPWTRARR
jgi:hypothetical protein